MSEAVPVDDLATKALGKLTERGMSISCAESLTGGLLADAFVRIPGASQTFRGGVVTYTNEMKTAVLSVSSELLRTYTAYDPQVAQQMSTAVREMFHSDFALSTTGVAGPGPDEGVAPGKGFVSLTTPQGTEVQAIDQPGTRAEIRVAFVRAALELLVSYLG
ncbi:CinA family protein [Mobiluncus curtisii]|uniref:CinA family protein n=1 Tax=Mobiluncus curtisii TaxID=2051 RepID=A0A7Y0UIA4_9ACTO|nr:CinA family protein [Mobiluncus curtisii]MCU9987545.1 CinA family protein [Mobiluncus curtisii]NMW49436.1 CinA family protein [Mobiluncus curtisii]NMW87872.1 CinA family protein [Mobiluncus curtisii]NMW89171.1 CinA family protein [Mobiluncus curtisii]